MQLPDEENARREVIVKASLLLVGIALNALEFFIPRVPLFPWLKPGLANCITLIWIIRYGFKESLLYALLRIWIVSFYFGFSFFTFTLGFSGAVSACCAMVVFWKFLGRSGVMGTVGVAIIGALFHNAGQLFMVYVLMAQNSRLLYQAPVMLVASIIFGGFVGLITPALLQISDQDAVGRDISGGSVPFTRHRISRSRLAVSLGFIAICIALVFVERISLLIGSAIFITCFVQGITRGSLQALLYPVRRFWLLFLCIGCIHGLFTYGTKIEYMPFLTDDGIRNAAIQWLRLWAWLETTVIFLRFEFHTALLSGVQSIFAGSRSTLVAGFIAVEFFPAVVETVQKKSGSLLKQLVVHPSRVVKDLYTLVVLIIANGIKKA